MFSSISYITLESSTVLLVVLIAFALGVFAAFFIYRNKLSKKQRVDSVFQKVLLLVTLPKESSSASAQEKEHDPEYMKKLLSAAENFFTTIGGTRAQRGIQTLLRGRSDHISFEIVAQHGLISFYVSVPFGMREYMHQMILSQYPEASVEEVEEYNIFDPASVTEGCYLLHTREFIFPLKTYLKTEGDPLNALTNSLSKIAKGDAAAIQIVARSSKKSWHTWGSRAARYMQEGKKVVEAVKSAAPGVRLSKVFASTKPKRTQHEMEHPERPYQLTPMEQEVVKALEEKTSKAGLDTNIRVVVSAHNEVDAQRYLNNIVDSFSQFNLYQYGNSLRKKYVKIDGLIDNFIYRDYISSRNVLLNAEEIASIYHFPTPFTETPNIRWLLAKKLSAPVNLPTGGLLLGENVYRGMRREVFIKDEDRRRHMYIIGMTGTGKSTLMENLIIQDIQRGRGVCVIDPHGTLVENILPAVPLQRVQDVIYFDPSDTQRPMGLNILEAKDPQQQDMAVQEMIAIFYKLVADPSMIGPMFEHNMRNAMLTLMADTEHPGTIADIPRIFTDEKFQKYKVSKVTDPMVRNFWEKEMAKTSDFHKSEMLGYLISKVGRFVENSLMRNIIGQSTSSFNFRQIMDERKILLVSLSKGKVGEVNSNLLGLIMVSKLQMAALARADMPEHQRNDFYLYIDEFQNFITDSISTILAEARKYKLNLTLAHQYLGQLLGSAADKKDEHGGIKDAIFGNVGTMVSFRIGVDDSETMAKQFAPAVNEYDVMNIEKFNAYIRLLIDNQASKAFSLQCYPPIKGDSEVAGMIQENSRQTYGRDKQQVEEEILQSLKLGTESQEWLSRESKL